MFHERNTNPCASNFLITMSRESMMLHVKHKFFCRKKKAEWIFKPPKKKQGEQKTEFNKQQKKGGKNVTNNLFIVLFFLLVNLLQDDETVNIFHIIKNYCFLHDTPKTRPLLFQCDFHFRKLWMRIC